MISLRALKTRPDEFVEDRYSWREQNEIVMRRKRTAWGAYWDWVSKHRAPAIVVLVLATITIGYLALVFGFGLGLGLGYLIFSS